MQKQALMASETSGLLTGSSLIRKFATFLEENELLLPEEDDVE